jgi:chaperonin cofactor prefoldin
LPRATSSWRPTADIEAKVEALAAKIDDLKKQAVSVATRLEAIEKVI